MILGSAGTSSSLGNGQTRYDTGLRRGLNGDLSDERPRSRHRMERVKTEAELAGHQQRRCPEDDDVVDPPKLEGGIGSKSCERPARSRRADGLEPGLAEGSHRARQDDPPDMECADQTGDGLSEARPSFEEYYYYRYRSYYRKYPGVGSEAKAETERLQQQTEAEIAKIQAHAEQEIASAGKAARMALKRYSAELAMALAEQKVRARMTPDTEDALVQGFVRNLK